MMMVPLEAFPPKCCFFLMPGDAQDQCSAGMEKGKPLRKQIPEVGREAPSGECGNFF
jgi:hypothetical protein